MKEPLLNIYQIQANILPGFRLPAQHLILVRTTTVASAIELIATTLPRITTMREAVHFHSGRLQSARKNYNFGLASFRNFDAQPVWLNIGLGRELLDMLGAGDPAQADRSFSLGLAKRSFALGDPRDPANEGHKSNWLVGGPENAADLIFIVGSPNIARLDEAVDEMVCSIEAGGNEVIYHERGNRLEGDKEHFGFRDGVSQPAVRGLISNNPKQFLTKRRVHNAPNGPEYSAPGTVLVWPGEFVFGYPRQNPNHFRDPAPLREEGTFLKNGSFLVFRRLKQDVKRFREETDRMSAVLASNAAFAAMTPELFRASLVGRWPDASPLVRYPKEPPVQCPDENEINYFNFGNAVRDLTLVDNKTVKGADGDPYGIRCPFHAHIRKVNPRDRATDLGSETNTQKLRILRRGIPFGPPYVDAPDDANRGLLFLCYQTSIRDQFEQLTMDWVNSTVNPEPGNNEGYDMVLGQNGAASNRERFCIFRSGSGTERSVATLSDWVIPTGGGYFFFPSISTLQDLQNSP